ncbi:translation initiation factor IF-2-like [Meles meles]|uniref:translation initiation factor IF-2-like n=1 Tax=Meles meles TaxID=9662 RepID=UPI001E6987A1|nr:translation initiation factor IF-2-like [Meles meles]
MGKDGAGLCCIRDFPNSEPRNGINVIVEPKVSLKQFKGSLCLGSWDRPRRVPAGRGACFPLAWASPPPLALSPVRASARPRSAGRTCWEGSARNPAKRVLGRAVPPDPGGGRRGPQGCRSVLLRPAAVRAAAKAGAGNAGLLASRQRRTFARTVPRPAARARRWDAAAPRREGPSGRPSAAPPRSAGTGPAGPRPRGYCGVRCAVSGSDLPAPCVRTGGDRQISSRSPTSRLTRPLPAAGSPRGSGCPRAPHPARPTAGVRRPRTDARNTVQRDCGKHQEISKKFDPILSRIADCGGRVCIWPVNRRGSQAPLNPHRTGQGRVQPAGP